MSGNFSSERGEPAYRRDPQQKQALLLAAARELFASQGYDQTSTIQIAQRAGVSEGILFHHFGSKRSLFTRIAEDYARDVAAAMLPGEPADVTEESVVRNAFAFVREDPSLYKLFAARGAELAELVFTRQREIVLSAIEANLGRNMQLGMVRSGNARVMAELVYALVSGALNAWQTGEHPAREQDYIDETIRCMEAMLTPQGS
jgi:AcrR family transcriptional regulator